MKKILDMKQTAVESFWSKIALRLSVEQVNEFLPEFQKAKAMEKEQIINAHIKGHYAPSSTLKYHDAEQYYNETYNQ